MRKRIHALLGLSVFAGLMIVVATVAQHQSDAYRREKLQERIDKRRTLLEQEMHDRLHMVRGLSAFVKSNPEFTDAEFMEFASALEGDIVGLRSLQLAPNAVVTYLTHPEKNESARGHDLLGDPASREFVQRAIDRKEYIIAGPVDLIQGGTAIVGRLPIYIPDSAVGPDQSDAIRESFWGFATALIDIEPLIEAAGIDSSDDSIAYALRGRDGRGAEGEVFHGEPSVFESADLIVDVAIPNGTWQIAVTASSDWGGAPPGRTFLWLGGLASSGLASWLLYLLLQRPEILRLAVEESTRALHESEERLRHSQKMEALGQLTGGLAHDFNNLLAVIVGNLDLLKESANDRPEIDGRVETALEAAERGAGLTRSLLAFSRKQMLEPRVCNLNELVKSTTSMLARTLGETIRIETELAPDLAPNRIDPNQFQSLVLNLAINARHAMPDGGTLSILTRNTSITQQVGDIPPGEYTLFSLADDGTGMTPEALEHAFEPFFTTKRGTGSGLGLSMIYGFVKQSGGHIRIDSTPGAGTTVEVLLPSAEAPALSDAGHEKGSNLSLMRTSRLVLLVEDESAVRQVVRAQLESFDCRVIDAEDAKSALSAHAQARRVDVLLTDVVMPGGMSGYDLAAELRRRQPDIDVLFMSGYDEAAERSSERPGTLIQKPFRMLDLKAALDALL